MPRRPGVPGVPEVPVDGGCAGRAGGAGGAGRCMLVPPLVFISPNDAPVAQLAVIGEYWLFV